MKQTSATVLYLATALVTVLSGFGTVSPARANESAAATPTGVTDSAGPIPSSNTALSSDTAAAIAPRPAESSPNATNAQPTTTAIQSSLQASANQPPFFLQIKAQVPKASFMEELRRLQLESQNKTLAGAGSAESASMQNTQQNQQNAQTSVNILRKPNLPPTSTGLLAPHSQFGYDGLGDGGSMYGGELILPATRLAPINLEIAQ